MTIIKLTVIPEEFEKAELEHCPRVSWLELPAIGDQVQVINASNFKTRNFVVVSHHKDHTYDIRK